MNIMGNSVIMNNWDTRAEKEENVLANKKEENNRGKRFGNTSLNRFTLMGSMKKKNIYINSSFQTFL